MLWYYNNGDCFELLLGQLTKTLQQEYFLLPTKLSSIIYFSVSTMDPMKDWNKGALVVLTTKLKVNIIMKNGLNDKLITVAGGFMIEAEAKVVLSKSNNAEQMGELIYILLGKSDADFDIFCNMLKAVGYGVWASELKKTARLLKTESGNIHEKCTRSSQFE